MENLGLKDLRDILQIAEIANGALDRELLGPEVLDALSGSLGVEKCMFILQEEGSACPEFFSRGIERADVDRYITYFHSQDPLALLAQESDRIVVCPSGRQRATVCLQDTVSYGDFVASEYYKEFYRPQGILYEIATRIETSTRVRAVVDLLRSAEAPAFTARDIQVMDCLAPYLSRAIEGIELRREIEVKNGALAHYEARLPEKVLLCNERLRVVYASASAKEAFESMTGGPLSSILPAFLREDLAAYREGAKALPDGVFPASSQREVQGAKGRFRLTYGTPPPSGDFPRRPLLSVSIQRCGEKMVCRNEVLMDRFGLTRREVEIVTAIFDGKTNAQIADRLFISEFTVKKHLQNICEKLNVRSRTAILSKVLRCNPSDVLSAQVPSVARTPWPA